MKENAWNSYSEQDLELMDSLICHMKIVKVILLIKY